ncbi:MAG: tail fiber domain-containing protein, partial [Anaerolineae bacterium]
EDGYTVPVENGLFTVFLEIPPALFDGQALWLGVQVEGDTQEMTPRQQLLPAPYALYAKSAPWNGLVGVPSDLADGDDDTLYSAWTGLGLVGTQFSIIPAYRLPQGCANGAIPEWNATSSTWDCGTDDGTPYSAGTGLTLVGAQFSIIQTYRLPQGCTNGAIAEWNASSSTWDCGTDDVGNSAAAWLLGGNTGTTPGTDVLGTTDATSLTLVVNGVPALRLEPDAVPNLIGGYWENSVTSSARGATIGGGGESGYPNRVTDDYATIGGGYDNTASSYGAVIGGGSNNTASGSYGATVAGGDGNIASGDYAPTIGGGKDNVVTGDFSVIGGGYDNTVSEGYATVGGGEDNTVSEGYATVSGGLLNIASGERSTVGGGSGNTASGERSTVGGGSGNTADSFGATIAGGMNNVVTGTLATIGGGSDNTAEGAYTTIGGGDDNIARGDYATIAGGRSNYATGDYSFAAGRRANAADDGCFVWGDSTDAMFHCTNPNRFMVRASGGVYLYTNSTVSTGAYLAPNSGSWSSLSDRNAKENFQSVDPEYVLEQVVQMPVSTWNYIGEAEGIRHLGPMAQDFYAAFGLGDSERYINTLDADGVALVAIQGLYAKNQALEAEVSTLKTENATLKKDMSDLAARVAALERGGTPQATSTLTTWWPLAGAVVLAGIVVAQRRRQEVER